MDERDAVRGGGQIMRRSNCHFMIRPCPGWEPAPGMIECISVFDFNPIIPRILETGG